MRLRGNCLLAASDAAPLLARFSFWTTFEPFLVLYATGLPCRLFALYMTVLLRRPSSVASGVGLSGTGAPLCIGMDLELRKLILES